MMKLIIAFFVAAAALAVTDGYLCQDKSLNSNNYRYASTNLPAPIQKIYQTDRRSTTLCTLDATFGVSGSVLWVNRGCRSNFRACYRSPYAGRTRTVSVTCSSSGYSLKRCNAGGTVVDLVVSRPISSSPCIDGASFYGEGNKVVVNHGCRATFSVTLQN